MICYGSTHDSRSTNSRSTNSKPDVLTTRTDSSSCQWVRRREPPQSPRRVNRHRGRTDVVLRQAKADHRPHPAAVGCRLQHLLARVRHVARGIDARYRRGPIGAHPEPCTDHDRVGIDAVAVRQLDRRHVSIVAGGMKAHRMGDDADDAPVANLETVTERAMDHVAAPMLRQAVDLRQLVDQARGGQHPTSDDRVPAHEFDAEA